YPSRHCHGGHGSRPYSRLFHSSPIRAGKSGPHLARAFFHALDYALLRAAVFLSGWNGRIFLRPTANSRGTQPFSLDARPLAHRSGIHSRGNGLDISNSLRLLWRDLGAGRMHGHHGCGGPIARALARGNIRSGDRDPQSSRWHSPEAIRIPGVALDSASRSRIRIPALPHPPVRPFPNRSLGCSNGRRVRLWLGLFARTGSPPESDSAPRPDPHTCICTAPCDQSLRQSASRSGRRLAGSLARPTHGRKDRDPFLRRGKISALVAIPADDAWAVASFSGLARQADLTATYDRVSFRAGSLRPRPAVLLCSSSIPDPRARRRDGATVPSARVMAASRRILTERHPQRLWSQARIHLSDLDDGGNYSLLPVPLVHGSQAKKKRLVAELFMKDARQVWIWLQAGGLSD